MDATLRKSLIKRGLDPDGTTERVESMVKNALLNEFEPSSESIATLLKRRKERLYQRRHRGDKESARDLYENACIVAAWEAGEVSEGQAMRALGIDRVSARELKLCMIALGRAIACEMP